MSLKKVVSNLLSMGLLIMALPLGAAMADNNKQDWVYSQDGLYAVRILSPAEGSSLRIGEGIDFRFDRKHPENGDFSNYAGIFRISEDGEPDTRDGLVMNYNLDKAELEDECYAVKLDTTTLEPGEYYFGYGIRDEEGKAPEKFAAQYIRVTLLAAVASPTPTDTLRIPMASLVQTQTPEPATETATPIPTPEPSKQPTASEVRTPEPAPTPEPHRQWMRVGERWTYSIDGHLAKNGWYRIEGKWYLFNSQGYMLTGWQQRGSHWYYLRSSGAMQTGWLRERAVDGEIYWYYLGGSGQMQTGWRQISDGGKQQWYYFAGNGRMRTGWLKIADKWYYFNADGAMATGWAKVADSSGAGASWYYLNANGDMHTGWLPSNGSWYYLQQGSGAMATNSTLINDILHNFTANGVWLGKA